MYLRRIELYGFKSFAGEVVLELSPGITVLVGPNGGGKSNVVDAIRWVLGEQRIRELRADRWEELLFSGGPGRRPAQVSEAFLEFDNRDGAVPAWPETLRVGRRLFRQGDSEYVIGSRAVRLKDVTDLFLDSGLGRSAYAIIGQGRVEQTLTQRPQDRLEQLEEAAGTTRYKVRRRETRQQLEAVRHELGRAADLEAQVAEEQKAVEAEAERESQYRALETERQALRARIRQYRRAVWTEAAARAESDLAALETVVRELGAELSAVGQELGGLSVRIDEEQAAARVVAEAADQARRAVDAQAREVTRWAERREGLERLAQQARETLAREEAALAETPWESWPGTEAEPEALEAADELQRLLGAAEERLAAAQALRDARRAEVEDRRRQWEERQRLQAQLARLVDSPGDLSRLGDRLAREAERAREELDGLEGTVRDGESQLAALRGYATEQRERLRLAEQHFAQRQARHRALQQLEAEGEGYGPGVRAVLRAQADGQLRGIQGTLGSLIEAEDEHLIAVQAALGAAAQDLVADSERTARAAVRHLQAHGLGRATFLPLDTVRPGRPLAEDRDLVRQPGVVGWALDLIRVPEAVRVAAAHALGRVLVLEKLEDAVAVGRLVNFRYRLVTLDGQLIHPGGAITGGSPAASGGVWVRRQEIDRLARELTDELSRLNGLREVVAGAEEEIAQAEARLLEWRARRTAAHSAWSAARMRLETVDDLVATHDVTLDEAALRAGLEEARAQWQTAEQDWEDARRRREEAREALLRRQAAHEESRRRRAEQEALAARVAEERERAERRRAEAGDRLRQWETERGEVLRQWQDATLQLQERQADLARAEAEVTRYRDLLAETDRRRQAAAERERRVDHELRRRMQDRQKVEAERDRLVFQLAELGEEDPPVAAASEDWSDMPAVEARLAAVEQALGRLPAIAPGSLALYQRLGERREFLRVQREDIERAAADLENTIAELDREVETRRMETATRVEKALQETVQDLFGGGSVRFRWQQEPDPGLELWMEPPGKRPQSLQSLSGGEKALGALAWLFALLAIRPAPLVVLDEVEASLDELNARRFAQHLARRRHTQYLVVTHHKPTMEQADALWGFTADPHGVSRLVSVRMGEEVTG